MAMQAIRAASKETVPGIPSRLPALAGETFGTFVLTLSGTATLLATARIGHSTAASVGSQIAVSVAFGFGILAAVYAVATVSGAHINPAVTFGLAAAREFPWRLIPAYWAAQLLGGILAALVNWGMYGDKLGSALDLSTTRPGPGVPVIVALLAEFVLTAVLLIVVMSTAVYRRGDARGAGDRAVDRLRGVPGVPGLRRLAESGPDPGPGHRLRGLPGRVDLHHRPAGGAAFGRWIWQYLKRPSARAGRTTSLTPGPGGRSTAARRRSGKVLNK